MLSGFEIFLIAAGVPTAYSLFIHTPKRRAFLSALKGADPDTWIATNCPDGIIEKAGDDQLAVRLRLARYIWKREYVSRHNDSLTNAADRLRTSSAISYAIGVPAMAVVVWDLLNRT
jgi:hypothetical protein